jgi:hypothetical protein
MIVAARCYRSWGPHGLRRNLTRAPPPRARRTKSRSLVWASYVKFRKRSAVWRQIVAYGQHPGHGSRLRRPRIRSRRVGAGRRAGRAGRAARSASRARSRSSLKPTSANTRLTASTHPRLISTSARISPVPPPNTAAHTAPATTSSPAEPKPTIRDRRLTAFRRELRSGYSSPSTSSGTSSSASSSTNPSEERPSPIPSRSERSGSGPPNPVRPSPSVRPSSAARSS